MCKWRASDGVCDTVPTGDNDVDSEQKQQLALQLLHWHIDDGIRHINLKWDVKIASQSCK